MHVDKDWVAIPALIPGRTQKQCNTRWHDNFNPSNALTAGRKGEWTSVEDSKLKDAVQTHGDKDWVAVSVRVPGRTKKQFCDTWRWVKR
jgi:myb proto-oncogene protein